MTKQVLENRHGVLRLLHRPSRRIQPERRCLLQLQAKTRSEKPRKSPDSSRYQIMDMGVKSWFHLPIDRKRTLLLNSKHPNATMGVRVDWVHLGFGPQSRWSRWSRWSAQPTNVTRAFLRHHEMMASSRSLVPSVATDDGATRR